MGAQRRANKSQTTTKIGKLAQIAQGIRQGENYSITRLTTIKSLCKDPETAVQFILYVAQLTRKKMRRKACPDHLDKDEWRAFKKLVIEAVLQMEDYLEEPNDEKISSLRELYSTAKEFQNEHKYIRGGPVRIIKNRDVLLIEYALRGVFSPHESSYWSYHVAKGYAEKYDSGYGGGLVSDSALMVEEIVDFWCRFHLGKSLKKWLAEGMYV